VAVAREGGKQPYFIHPTDRELFGFAGIWDQSTTADGKVVESCTIITIHCVQKIAEYRPCSRAPWSAYFPETTLVLRQRRPLEGITQNSRKPKYRTKH
jgi:hypothetical protein